MSDYTVFEYQAKLTNPGHAEDEGKPVHCMIRMKNVDRDGKRLHNVELAQQAWDNAFAEVDLQKPGKASDYHRVGDCEIYFYNA